MRHLVTSLFGTYKWVDVFLLAHHGRWSGFGRGLSGSGSRWPTWRLDSHRMCFSCRSICWSVTGGFDEIAWWGWIVRSIRSVESLGAFRSPRRVWRGFVVLGFFRSLRRPIGALSHCLWSIRRRIITLALLLTFGITLLGLDIWRIICDLHNGYLWICAGNLFLLLTFGCLHSQLDMSSFLVLETLSIRLG